MPNFNKSFQDEVRRLARKELKVDIQRIKKDNAELKRALAAAKRRIAKLESRNRLLVKEVGVTEKVQEREAGTWERLRVSSTTIRSLRSKLGVTQAQLADLLGVSGQSVYQWERRSGALKLRAATKQALHEIRDIGAREARRRIEELKKLTRRSKKAVPKKKAAAKKKTAAKKKPAAKKKAVAKKKPAAKKKAAAKKRTARKK